MKKKKFKKKIIIFGILLILLIAIFLYGYFFVKSRLLTYHSKEMIVEDHTKLFSNDCLKDIENITIISPSEVIDTTKAKTIETKVKIKNIMYRDEIFTCVYKIVDKTAPTLENVKDITTTEGESVDLLKGIKATDNCDTDLKIEVIGDYNFKKADTYKLKYSVSDSSNNVTTKDFKLTVKEKPKNSSKTSKGYTIYVKNGITYIDGYLIANKTYALPASYNPGGLTREFKDHYTEMQLAAEKEGLTLKIFSGYRSYNTQVNVYNSWIKKDGKAAADTYSARPGHSEHQSGLAADINKPGGSFNETKETEWMAKNAYKYGFILRYPKGKQSITGYIYESWHFRYVGVDLAKKLYNNGDWITMEEYFGITSKY